MEVVDGVAPVVLDVPAETREAHSNVQPGHLIQETGRGRQKYTSMDDQQCTKQEGVEHSKVP